MKCNPKFYQGFETDLKSFLSLSVRELLVNDICSRCRISRREESLLRSDLPNPPNQVLTILLLILLHL